MVFHLIYPHQLFKAAKHLDKAITLVFIEEPLFFTQYRFHRHKLLLHRETMKSFAETLASLGFTIRYIESSDIKHTSDIFSLLSLAPEDSVQLWDPVDNWLEKRLQKVMPEITYLDSPGFFLNKAEVESYFPKAHVRFSMAAFYKKMRMRTGYLMENQKPLGGKWSFDEDNRKALPKNTYVPPLPEVPSLSTETVVYIQKHFPENPGKSEDFFLPTTHSGARIWLDSFLQERFSSFGPYEDALHTSSPFLFHSVLSPLINIGLLTPKEVIEEALAIAKKQEIPLASLEGFIRQILGWREYIRALYEVKGTEMRLGNALEATRAMPSTFYMGNTGLLPFDKAVETTRRFSYNHHIERLMVLGNFMSLCSIHPKEVYQWFMELYIDAYDWVMVPNVYGMSQYAGGKVMTTKPYVSGSAYILKMSNYPKGEWCTVWDGLYWQFIEKHRALLSTNPRLAVMTKYLDRMPEEKRNALWESVAAWKKTVGL